MLVFYLHTYAVEAPSREHEYKSPVTTSFALFWAHHFRTAKKISRILAVSRGSASDWDGYVWTLGLMAKLTVES